MERDKTDRGQVGIGTLIVFIAMVLVAAIAAGVLVNTAGFLQATAEDAGQESVNKVTNRVDVVSTHGMVTNASGTNYINYLNVTVRMAAGSGSVSLQNTTIKYLSGAQAETLTYSESAADSLSTTDGEFNVTKINDDDTSYKTGAVLNSQSDRFEIRIDTGTLEEEAGLPTGETVKLDITSRNGGTTQVILTMPQQLAGKSPGDPVPL
jgi:flagellin FlaB